MYRVAPAVDGYREGVPGVSAARFSLPARYRLVGHIANGGMAGVWEAHDELLDRAVAVKVLAAHLSEDDRARKRFQREARAVAGLSSHPHVVTIYDVGEYEGRTFMVMELMRGGTLAERLAADEEIPHARALRWLREAAEGLDAAHDAGIVHRDVKPANLLLDERDRLAIADFGIARLAWEDQVTQTGQVLGTAAYISPEQAMGEPATAASDRYALAVVAFELLTGSRPFRPSTSPPRRGRTWRTIRRGPRASTRSCRAPSTGCSTAAWRRSRRSAGAAPRPSSTRSTAPSARRAARARRPALLRPRGSLRSRTAVGAARGRCSEPWAHSPSWRSWRRSSSPAATTAAARAAGARPRTTARATSSAMS